VTSGLPTFVGAQRSAPYLQTTCPPGEKPLNNFHTPPALVLCGFAALAGVRTEQAAPLVDARDTTSPAKPKRQDMKTNVRIKTRPVGKQNRKERRMRGSRRWVALWALVLAAVAMMARMGLAAGTSVQYDTNKIGLLIKFDDLNSADQAGAWQHWWASGQCWERTNVAGVRLRCSDGIWAESLLEGNYTGYLAEYLNLFMAESNRDQFELWLHGWYAGSGSGWAEQTYHSGYKTQLAMFLDSQKATIDRFGAVLRTWGPHFWGPDADTGWIFSRDPLIDVWFRYSDGTVGNIISNAYNWKYVFEPHYYWKTNSPVYGTGTFPCVDFDGWDKDRQLDVLTNWPHVPLGCRSLDAFSNALCHAVGLFGYEATNGFGPTNPATEFVVQGHPHAWDAISRTHYTNILDWLINTNIGVAEYGYSPADKFETRLPSYWSRVKSQPGKLIQAPAGAPASVSCGRIGPTERSVYISWQPVLEEKESPSDPDIICPAYIIRRNGTVIGTAGPSVYQLPLGGFQTNWAFTDVSSEYIPDGTVYSVQAVSSMWVLGSNSATARLYLPLRGQYSFNCRTMTAFEGEPTEGVLELSQIYSDDPVSVTLLLSDGIPDAGWQWSDTGTYSNTVELVRHEPLVLRYWFDGQVTNLNSVVWLLNNNNQTWERCGIPVSLYHKEMRLAPADFENFSGLVGSGSLVTNTSSMWRNSNLDPLWPEIWNDALVLSNRFSTDGFSNRCDVILRAETYPKNETANNFLISINDTNWSRAMVWNVVTNGGSDSNAVVSIATSCVGVEHAINLPKPGNYGTSFPLPEFVEGFGADAYKFGMGDTNSADPQRMTFSLPPGTNTLYFGFLEADAGVGWVELWSLEDWRSESRYLVTVNLQVGGSTNGPWTNYLSTTRLSPMPSLYYWAYAEPNGTDYTIKPRWSRSVTGPWGQVPEWNNVTSPTPYFRYTVERY
jgi:hypothetical protein